MGWEARRPDLARKFARMGAGRLGGLRVLIDWNTHFVVFSGGFEQGLGGSAARCSWKTRKNGGWEARRLDPAGMITPPPPAAPGTRANEGGGPSQGFLYGYFFTLKWRWVLNQEITDSAAQQGWCPRSAVCNSWCIHHPAVCDGRMCTAGAGAGRADGPIWLKNSPKQGLRGLAA